MQFRISIITAVVAFVTLTTGRVANAYIHFPPTTLQKMSKISHHIRVLKVDKFDKDKGVIVFAKAEILKDQPFDLASLKHVIRRDADGTKPIFDWLENGKTAVMFSIEAETRGDTVGVGYVFIDKFCYSVDYNSNGKYWLLIRAEPSLSACYYGSADQLRMLTKDTLNGKEVQVPTKSPDLNEDRDTRNREINDIRMQNRTK